MASDAEHPFICFWTHCMSSLEKCLFKSFTYFLIGLFGFLEWTHECFIYFGDQTLVQDITGKYIFPYDWFNFNFTAIFFSHAEAFYFDEVPILYFSFMFLAVGNILVNMLLLGISQTFLLMFSSRTFVLSQLIFKSSIHLEFIFVNGVSWWSSFLFLYVAV